MRISSLALLLLAAPALFADTLSDLRGALEHLKGQDPVRAKVEIRTWNKNGEGKKSKERVSAGQVQVEDGPQGLRLGWTAAQMQSARKDAQAKAVDPEAATPNLETLKALDAAEASRLLSYADSLGLMLQGAQLLEDKPEAYQGKPARMLLLKPEARFSAEDKDIIKSFEVSLKVWVGPDGIPLGLEKTLRFKGSKFLISFRGSQAESTSLARVGNRLVAMQCTKETSGSGMGMTSQGKTVSNLTLF